MPDWPAFIDPSDLAPGDSVPHAELPRELRLVVAEKVDSAPFETGFRLLGEYFSAAGEMEIRPVLEQRMNWDPVRPEGRERLLYQMMLLYCGDECVAVRDHTAIMREGVEDVVVHLSHVLVTPKWRRRGLAAILRTLPVSTARECARRAGRAAAPVTLFCEMEPRDPAQPANIIRRRSYEGANFKALGSRLGYMQPDFRSPTDIDADPAGTRPIPFDILLRRVGRENAQDVPAAELHSGVDLVYSMYAKGFRESDMRPCLDWLESFRARPDKHYPLHMPTQAP
ncbi:MAG: hypothetical protein JW942_03445 [Opitutales bacterium]|nr:hypothetical protein [Opitutales bacterium]